MVGSWESGDFHSQIPLATYESASRCQDPFENCVVCRGARGLQTHYVDEGSDSGADLECCFRLEFMENIKFYSPWQEQGGG